MPEDPTKVLDALQSLVVQSRVVEGALPLDAPTRTVDDFRSALTAAACDNAGSRGQRVDHLRRVESRGPGLKTVPLGPYEVELVSFDPTDCLRVWHGGHLMAEIELSRNLRHQRAY